MSTGQAASVVFALATWLVPFTGAAQGPSPETRPVTTGPTFVMETVAVEPTGHPPLVAPPPKWSMAVDADSLRRQLGHGDRVSVVSTKGDLSTGRVERIGEVDLDLRVETRDPDGEKRTLTLTIPFDAIQSLDRPRDSSRDGLLIGAGAGAGLGIAMFAHAYAIDANEMDEWAAGYVGAAVVFTGIGALVGWAIDTAHSKPHFRYERAAGSGAHVRFVPFGRHGKGLAAVVTF